MKTAVVPIEDFGTPRMSRSRVEHYIEYGKYDILYKKILNIKCSYSNCRRKSIEGDNSEEFFINVIKIDLKAHNSSCRSGQGEGGVARKGI